MTVASHSGSAPKVFMMDLLATVPYYTAYLSQALLAEGIPVSVGSIPYYLDPQCFRSRGLKLTSGLLHSAAIPRLPRALRRFLKLGEAVVNLLTLTLRFLIRPPDVIHVQFLPLLQWHLSIELLFLAVCRRRGSKVLLTVHDLLPHDTGDRFRPVFEKLYASVDGLICHSTEVRSRLVAEFGVSEQKISVIPHGPFFSDLPAQTGLEERNTIDSEEVVVLWQGILQLYKGVDVLLEGWRRVEAERGTAKLIIAGIGDKGLLSWVTEEVRRLDLQRVHLDFRFLTTEELLAMYRRADIVVYPYRAITTSGALATGLALGKAIIASDLPVFREALREGEDGVLVPPGDAEALAGAILRLSGSRNERVRFAAQVRSRNFGEGVWLDIARRTADVYRRLTT